MPRRKVKDIIKDDGINAKKFAEAETAALILKYHDAAEMGIELDEDFDVVDDEKRLITLYARVFEQDMTK